MPFGTGANTPERLLVNDVDVVYASVMRSCAKMGCGEAAAASVGVRYAARTAVIGELAPSPDPNLLDLCEQHAARLTAPRGWRVADERPVVAATDGGVPVDIAATG